jgi:hypothetical protein
VTHCITGDVQRWSDPERRCQAHHTKELRQQVARLSGRLPLPELAVAGSLPGAGFHSPRGSCRFLLPRFFVGAQLSLRQGRGSTLMRSNTVRAGSVFKASSPLKERSAKWREWAR